VTYAIERLVDIAADELEIDRLALRRKNLIRPQAMPYRNAVGMIYDSGRYQENMAWAMDVADWKGFAARRREARRRGKLLGLGLANYVESSIGAPREQTRIKVQPEGRVDVIIGTQPSGQGHETSFAQVISDLLFVPSEAVRIILGDTDIVEVGGGSHSGRSMRHAATVFSKAAVALIGKGKEIAALLLNAAPENVSFDDGRFAARDTNRTFDFFELAREFAREAAQLALPESLNDGLAVVTDNEMHDPVFPNGTAICEVEIDPDTGEMNITRYASVDDVGRCINPLIVHGQTHGAIAQGVGQAMSEQIYLDLDSGQPLTGSLMDYAMPIRCRPSPSKSPKCSRQPIRSASKPAAKVARLPRQPRSSAAFSMRCVRSGWARSRCRRRPMRSGRRSRRRRHPHPNPGRVDRMQSGHLYLPLKGGGRRAKRAGWGSARSAMDPHLVACGDHPPPFRGR
jgi:carbon-monoxide dehydrogenase large subunit